jgi:hypothetical protein
MKRYLRKFRQGRSLSPGKAPGKRPILDEQARRLHEEDRKGRPFVTLRERCEYLPAMAGLEIIQSVAYRTTRWMDSTRKRDTSSQ